MKMRLLNIFLGNIKKQKFAFIMLIITSVFGAIQQCVTPWAIRYALNISAAVKYRQISVTSSVAVFLIIFFISEIIIRSQGFFIAIVLPEFKKNMKYYLISKIFHKDYAYFLERMPGSLTQKINDFALSSERIIQIIFYNFFPILLSILLAAFFLYTIEPFYSLLIIVWFSIHIVTTWYRLKKSLKIVQYYNKIHAFIAGTLSELISRVIPIKVHLAETYEQEQLEKHLLSEKLSLREAQFYFEKVKIVQSLFSLIFILILVIHQVIGFNKGDYSIGDFVFVAFLTFNLTNYVWFSSFQLTVFSRELGTVKESYKDLVEGGDELRKLYPGHNIALPNTPDLSVRNLTYLFSSGMNAISGLSLEITFGEKILVQGRSGIGKSTFARLLVGLHAGFQGQVMLGGRNLNDLTRVELNQLVILVEQHTLLFSRTIKENICYNTRYYSDAELENVLKITHCDEFLRELPKGLNTQLGEQGVSLSGGQIQRIAIARALLCKPKILILDESTSGLDKVLEKKIVNNLMAIKNQTLIIISHSMDLHSIMPKTIVFASRQHDRKYSNQGMSVC